MKNFKTKTIITSLLLCFITQLQAATIIVDANHGLIDNADGACSISEAIINANDDTTTHTDCVAGTGSDVIELTQDVTLSVQYDSFAGGTSTPAISSTLTLDGKGFALQRNTSVPCNLDRTITAGEFRILRTESPADLTLQNITIGNGCADGDRTQAHGGGLYNQGDFLSLQQVTFKQNECTLRGGAILHKGGTISLISNSLFVGNSGLEGGVIGMITPSIISTIENSTFSNNTGGIGSVIFMYDTTINTIQNVTFSGNSSSAAIRNQMGTINNLQNTLFHNNTALGDPDCLNSQSGTISNGNNNISTNPNSSCQGVIATVLDPLTVGDLSDNGGTTMTHALLAGSQALNAGDSNSTTTDQRGFIADGIRDLGAFEAQIPVVVAPIDIVIESTGATTAVTLGAASVTDVDQSGLTAIASPAGPFSVGLHTVTWSATDAQGHVGTDTQMVNVQAVLSGTVNGLNGSVTLNNGADNLTINSNGNFRFQTAINNLSNYSATATSEPATQTCGIINASGQVNGANITDITVNCTDKTLILSTPSLDYGVVFLGETSTQTVTLTNSGTGDVTIASFTNPPAPFTIIGGSCLTTPITLTASQSCDFIVEFTSSGEGDFSGSFDVLSNAASSPATINLLGHSAIRIIPTLNFYGLLLMMGLFLGIAKYRNKI